MADEEKPTDAEEIFSEFQKKREDKEVQSEKSVETTEPTPELKTPEPEPELAPPEPTPKLDSPSEKTSQEVSAKNDNEKENHVRNVIFVGIKPIMTYVTATLTQLSTEPTVTIKARGKRITQAVDVSQMIVKRMDSVGYKVSDVRISSDLLKSQDGKERHVSTIEIDVSKP